MKQKHEIVQLPNFSLQHLVQLCWFRLFQCMSLEKVLHIFTRHKQLYMVVPFPCAMIQKLYVLSSAWGEGDPGLLALLQRVLLLKQWHRRALSKRPSSSGFFYHFPPEGVSRSRFWNAVVPHAQNRPHPKHQSSLSHYVLLNMLLFLCSFRCADFAIHFKELCPWKLEVAMVLITETAVFWDVMPCSFTEVCSLLRGNC
jgi:hypothetical protein